MARATRVLVDHTFATGRGRVGRPSVSPTGRSHPTEEVRVGFQRLLTLGLAIAASAAGAAAQTIGVPDVSGDQLLYVYDARTNRVPFLTVANPSDETVFIDVAFYSQDLSSRLGGGVIELVSAANRVIDPTSDFGGPANGNAGLAVLTPVVSASDATPIVPPEPLVGGFTLANTQLGSGFGENPFARFAVTSSGDRAEPGTTVDGSAVSYERIAPEILVLPVYFNPQTLEPPERDGNRVVLATFEDQYGTPFEVSGRSDSASARFFDASGVPIATTTVTVNGVLLSNLQEIAGGANVLNGSGKVFFDVDPGSGNYFGLFSQSLGTFASGQRLPEALSIPVGNPGGSPTPNPSTTPVVPPTPTPAATSNPSGCPARLAATVTFDSTTAAGITIRINYPRTLDIPGALNDPQVLSSIQNLTGVDGLLSGSDQDEDPNDPTNENWPPFLDVGLVSITEAIPSGSFARITFGCDAAPSVGDFSCTVTDASDAAFMPIAAQCSIALQ
jgi:hypothetical protein